ncbi:MAG: hypothetical protein WC390_10125 [Sulfurimonas sp.]|jgi:hypothetical protein
MIWAISVAKLLAAILLVECGGNLNPPDGDGGKSIGPYQIKRAYWIDSKTPGKWQDCKAQNSTEKEKLRAKNYSEQVILNYWKRYGSKFLDSMSIKDCEKLARIHNGGPVGYKKQSTIKYWSKVKRHLDKEMQ